MFRVEMLPAERGDCIWIEYGKAKNPHRVLIDGGPLVTFDFLRKRIESLPSAQRRFDLLVVTHVDIDHLEGIVKLLNDPKLDIQFDDVWFNGYQQLEDATVAADALGGMEGEFMTVLIKQRKLPHNKAFGGKPVMIPPKSSKLPVHTLAGGMKLTLLSPNAIQLKNLRPKWQETVRGHGVAAGDAKAAMKLLKDARRFAPLDTLGEAHSTDVETLYKRAFHSDASEANASSIAFLAEFEGKSALLTGDAHAPIVAASITKWMGSKRLATSAHKLSHHGSKHNTSPDLIRLLDCPRYLFSSDGSRFNHPDSEAVAWAIKFGGQAPQLFFNYSSDDNKMWNAAALQRKHSYSATFPKNDGMAVDLNG